MSDVSPPVSEGPVRPSRDPVPWMVWFGLAGLVLSTVGVLAMPSPSPSQVSSQAQETVQVNNKTASNDALPATSPAMGDDAASPDDPIISPVEMVAVVPGDIDPSSDVDGTRALPSERRSSVESGAEPDDRRVGALYRLVDEICSVTPKRIMAGQDAFTIDLPLTTSNDPCLDDVALNFDREYPGAPEVLFDVLAAEEEQGLPVLHLSAIHTGAMPYLHLKSGKTLFVGAVVDRWELASIDESGATFTHGDRTFTLQMTDDRDPS